MPSVFECLMEGGRTPKKRTTKENRRRKRRHSRSLDRGGRSQSAEPDYVFDPAQSQSESGSTCSPECFHTCPSSPLMDWEMLGGEEENKTLEDKNDLVPSTTDKAESTEIVPEYVCPDPCSDLEETSLLDLDDGGREEILPQTPCVLCGDDHEEFLLACAPVGNDVFGSLFVHSVCAACIMSSRLDGQMSGYGMSVKCPVPDCTNHMSRDKVASVMGPFVSTWLLGRGNLLPNGKLEVKREERYVMKGKTVNSGQTNEQKKSDKGIQQKIKEKQRDEEKDEDFHRNMEEGKKRGAEMETMNGEDHSMEEERKEENKEECNGMRETEETATPGHGGNTIDMVENEDHKMKDTEEGEADKKEQESGIGDSGVEEKVEDEEMEDEHGETSPGEGGEQREECEHIESIGNTDQRNGHTEEMNIEEHHAIDEQKRTEEGNMTIVEEDTIAKDTVVVMQNQTAAVQEDRMQTDVEEEKDTVSDAMESEEKAVEGTNGQPGNPRSEGINLAEIDREFVTFDPDELMKLINLYPNISEEFLAILADRGASGVKEEIDRRGSNVPVKGHAQPIDGIVFQDTLEECMSFVFNCSVCNDFHPKLLGIECSHGVQDGTEKPTTHMFCSDCVRGYAHTASTENVVAEDGAGIRCLAATSDRCTGTIPAGKVLGVLDWQMREVVRKLMNWKMLRSSGQKIETCQRCDLPLVVEEAPHVLKVFTCPSCRHQHCRLCLKTYDTAHANERCEEQVLTRQKQLIAERITEQCVRKCPGCGVFYEKTQGCNKMICSMCGTPMCYVCQKAIPEGYQHFNTQGACFNQLLADVSMQDEEKRENILNAQLGDLDPATAAKILRDLK